MRVLHQTVLSTARRLQDIVWPRVCASCGRLLGHEGQELCFQCAHDLSALAGEPYCRTCGADRNVHLLIGGQCGRCRSHRGRFAAFVRVGRYDGPLRALILRFKHAFVLDQLLGSLLRDAIRGQINPGSVDHWVPIPSHWYRRWRRGFHPSRLLAETATRGWSGHVSDLLRLTRYVPPLHHAQSATERARKVRGAFQLISGVDLRGKTIGLIDDVMTTGCTLSEAARVVRRAGAKNVVSAVIARTSATARIDGRRGDPGLVGRNAART